MAWGTPTSRGSNVETTGSASTLVISSVTVAQGSLIVVSGCARVNTALGFTITDSGSNTYAVYQPTENTTPTPDISSFFGYAIASTALSNGSVTINYGETVGSSAAEVFETTGAAGSAIDSPVNASSTFATATPSQTSGTPTVAGDLMFANLVWNDNGVTYTEDAGNGWTNIRNQLEVGGPDSIVSTAYQVNAGTGTKTYAPVLSAGTSVGVIAQIGFKIGAPADFTSSQTLADVTAVGTMTVESGLSASVTLEDVTSVAAYETGRAYSAMANAFAKARQWPFRRERVRR
jgi:hypothetical protein